MNVSRRAMLAMSTTATVLAACQGNGAPDPLLAPMTRSAISMPQASPPLFATERSRLRKRSTPPSHAQNA